MVLSDRLKKYAVFICIGAAAAAAAFAAYRVRFPFAEQVELRLKDARFRMKGTTRPTSPVAVAAIDGRSIKELGRWPWSRELTARLLEALREQGAKVVALDIVFSEPQGEADRELAAAVKGAGNVVLGYFFRSDAAGSDPAAEECVRESRVKLLRVADGVNGIPVPEYPHLDGNIPAIGCAPLSQGFFNALPDPDGIYRSTPLLILHEGDLYPSLPLQALSAFLEKDLLVSVEGYGIGEVSVGELSIPVTEGGRLPLFYYGPAGTFPTFSVADIVAGRLPDGALRGKMVFIGATETGISDLRPSPLDPVLPGVEIHATMAANVLEGRFLTRDGRTFAVDLAAMALLPVLLGVGLAAVTGTLSGLALYGAALAGYTGLNIHLFSRHQLDTSLLYPLIALSLGYLGGEAYRNLVVEKKGRYLRRAFGSYLSPALVDKIAKNPDSLNLGGEEREITILFSDIRGFTTISESLTPVELVRMLNEYLSPMTQVILAEHGTLDKYIGDAIMAIFNAPLEVPDHAERACRSALRMREELSRVNVALTERGWKPIEIGIGVNTGSAVVGNMGSALRFDYTAIGDSVNLASRLEGLTKQYGVRILVTGETKEKAGDGFHFREVDLVRVKGKGEPVAIHELLPAPLQIVDTFHRALELYRGRRFEEAERVFGQITDADPVAAVYLERCAVFLSSPPPAEWDGVYTAKQK